MGFGLPAALGAAAALQEPHRESKVVVDIDGDGSFLMNIQVRHRFLYLLSQHQVISR